MEIYNRRHIQCSRSSYSGMPKCFICCFIIGLLLTMRTCYGRRLGEAIKINENNDGDQTLTNMFVGNLPTRASIQQVFDIIDDESEQNTLNADNNGQMIVIPETFRNGDESFLLQEQNYAPFPKWSNDPNDPNSIMDSILSFIALQNVFYDNYLQHKYDDVAFYDLPMNRTSDHPWGVVNGWWPENLYVLSKDGVYSSDTVRNITDHWNTGPFRLKKTGTENIMINAYNLLINDEEGSTYNIPREERQRRWPNLFKTILEENKRVPFLAHYSDYKGCNYHNWNNGQSSIPLFTPAASVDCSYTFPFPNSYDHTKPNISEWNEKMVQQKEVYGPLSERIQKVVWRGTLTGYFNETVRPPRYNLMKFVNSPDNLSESDRLLFDIHFNGFAFGANQYVSQEEVDRDLGGINDHWFYEQQFQVYKAILDIDGHSWSSRFGSLLCYNSVVLKVQPEWVDYFYNPRNSSIKLLPWKHYIPINSDFSDLVEKTKYVMDAKNEDHIREIIQNANDWCLERMLPEIVATDALDIWEAYVEVLQDGWNDKWDTMVTELFQPGHPQNLAKVFFTPVEK